MNSENINIRDLTPIVSHFHPNTEMLHLSNTNGTITVTCLPWTYIRTTQRVTLYIDDKAVADHAVLALEDRLGMPPVFEVPTMEYFKPGQTHTVQLVVTEPDGSDNPNSARSKILTFTVAS
ncbi:hypothetical protein [Brucella sp. 10RB9213]|uniref:hypothetical protein n=1 Tax=Brucella sp. 10RB9213 TaxID=1844039 RepID=UPI0012AE21F9|nr:hypothetical protein [Brucella sp. 10RB9213]MRN67582.1 hypothetical protein [Brucella sp. 10RB9213]